jgi:hypothetical protein
MPDSEVSGRSSSLPMRALAIVVLALAGWFLLKVVIGILASVATFIAIVAAIFAVIWAVRTL